MQLLRNSSSRERILLLASIAMLFLTAAAAQDRTGSATTVQPGASGQPEAPEANPGRPTVSTPATITPVGYLQFETGLLAAWHSPEFSSQTSFGEVTKLSVIPRLELLAAVSPFAHSDASPHNGTGDTSIGVQGVVLPGEGARPTLAMSYFGTVRSGNAPNLDIGSARNSVLFLASADVKGFHYDTNCIFNEAISNANARRAQFGQTLSVSHAVGSRFGIAGEMWHFTQPFLRGEAVGNLWALNYNARKTLVFDAGFDHGLTASSTRWEFLAGFTYLLPRRIALARR